MIFNMKEFRLFYLHLIRSIATCNYRLVESSDLAFRRLNDVYDTLLAYTERQLHGRVPLANFFFSHYEVVVTKD